jgi:SAM-dependent methyltransferase
VTDHASSTRRERWAEVWGRRRLDPSKGALLTQLLAADGFDTNVSEVSESEWTAYVRHWADELGIGAGTTVYEVGCGAGAFLYELDQAGSRTGGIDQSAALVEIATGAIPRGDFRVADAAELPTEPQVDVVLSSGVFGYFESPAYTSAVIKAMAAKATQAVAILDLPDAALQEAALTARAERAGGTEAYAERYEGLDHLYYDRAWVEQELAACGLERVATADQNLVGYGNSAFRFNAWGFHPS